MKCEATLPTAPVALPGLRGTRAETGSFSTTHDVHFADSRLMSMVQSASVDLVLTSPPYPMIAMWDAGFASVDPEVGEALTLGNGQRAYGLMHEQLDAVWAEVHRVTKPGAWVCINIGDATRTLGGQFRLYPNHARVVSSMCNLGFDILPSVVWRKPTNAPNKFMGSGTLPAGAYLTLEHERILVFRKGGLRALNTDSAKLRRRQSALFWEERNVWYSDLWELPGRRQSLFTNGSRDRTGAFPFELAYRVLCMYSVQGDLVLDPYAGTGSTTVAAIATGRNSIAVEIDPTLRETINAAIMGARNVANERLTKRLEAHSGFVEEYSRRKAPPRHRNVRYGPVVTAQETDMLLQHVASVRRTRDGAYRATYREAAGGAP